LKTDLDLYPVATRRKTPARVLAVVDDPGVLGVIRRALTSEGFAVEPVLDAKEALAAVHRHPPDVVLIDVVLAEDDGYELLADIRGITAVPVILVGGRDDEPDRAPGLRTDAEGYVVKPFSHPELVARIVTVLRRASPAQDVARRSFGRVTVDDRAREVRVGGMPVETTAKEFDLLAFLSASPRKVFTRQQLLERVWDSSAEWQNPATVTEHVRRLRRKIEEDPERPRIIVTVRGVGYRFEP